MLLMKTLFTEPEPMTTGTVLGHLTDYFGELIGTVTSPLDGVVPYVVVSPAMGTGEPVAMVGTVTSH